MDVYGVSSTHCVSGCLYTPLTNGIILEAVIVFKAYSPVPKWWPHIEGVDHLTIT